MFDEREEAEPHCFHDEDTFGICGGEDFLCFGGIHGEGFLAKDVLARCDGVEGVLFVEAVRCADVLAKSLVYDFIEEESW